MEEMIRTAVVLICSGLLFLICISLVMDRRYEEGFLGSIGLFLMGMTALCKFITVIDGHQTSLIGVFYWSGGAIFMLQYKINFLLHKNHERRRNDRSQDIGNAPN